MATFHAHISGNASLGVEVSLDHKSQAESLIVEALKPH